MVGNALLRSEVVGVEHEVAVVLEVHRCELHARRHALKLRHPQLDQEPPARTKVPGGVAEALDLFCLCAQVGDCVEDQNTNE